MSASNNGQARSETNAMTHRVPSSRRENAFLAAVVASGAGAATGLLATAGGHGPPLLLWVGVAAIYVMSLWPVEVDSTSDGVVIGLEPSVAVWMAFTAGSRSAATVWLVGTAVTQLSKRKNVWSRVFNVATTALAGVAAIATVSAVSGPATTGPRSLVAVAAATGVYFAVDFVLSCAATVLVDGATLHDVCHPPNLAISVACFACVMALGYLAAVVGRASPWAAPVIVLPVLTLCAAARAIRTTRVERARSLALFDLASGAQRAESEEEIAAVLATHGRRALRSPEVAVHAVEAGAAPGDDALVVRLPQGAATDGSVLVAAARGTGDPFDEDDRRTAEVIAALVAESRQRLSLLAELAQLARHDQLTGLVNRGAWHAEIEQRFERRAVHAGDGTAAPVALLFCDLDHFKHVNDTLGHAAGDVVLQVVGRRIASCVRPGDLAARLGGDEFAVALFGADRATATGVGERIREVLREPIDVGGRLVAVQASIGIAVVDEVDATASVERLLAQADGAMYRSKHAGRPLAPAPQG
jgi:diguanylate cyclase (GGDEF)-like protein